MADEHEPKIDRDELIALRLASVTFVASDGYLSTGIRTNEEAADVLLASDWLATRDRETAAKAWDAAVSTSTAFGLVDGGFDANAAWVANPYRIEKGDDRG